MRSPRNRIYVTRYPITGDVMSQLDLSVYSIAIFLKAHFGLSGTDLCQKAANDKLMPFCKKCVAFSHILRLPASL